MRKGDDEAVDHKMTITNSLKPLKNSINRVKILLLNDNNKHMYIVHTQVTTVQIVFSQTKTCTQSMTQLAYTNTTIPKNKIWVYQWTAIILTFKCTITADDDDDDDDTGR